MYVDYLSCLYFVVMIYFYGYDYLFYIISEYILDYLFLIFIFFFFKQKTAYEMLRSLVGSEMCIRDRGSAGNDVAMGELLSVRRVGGRVQPHQISIQQQQQRRYGGMMTRPSLVSLSVHTRFQVVPLQSSAWQRIYLSHNNTNATTSRSSGHGRDFADVFDMEILMPAAAASSSYTVGTAQSTVAPPSSGRWITLEGGSNQRWSGGQNNTSNGGDGSVLLVSDDCVPLGLGMFIPRGPNNVSSNPYMSASSITQQQHGLDEIESVSDSD
eukprot:TRINITY_DN60300_c0_g1_i1.p1 TRINITY_DN60300_c0_g1~~TRINITY_DN60300_c0_g1_i1.p1  ORF type:complete len:269 (+),score=24.87 TRINITY_DN60300_c0_g1_i1:2-808(+)